MRTGTPARATSNACEPTEEEKSCEHKKTRSKGVKVSIRRKRRSMSLSHRGRNHSRLRMSQSTECSERSTASMPPSAAADQQSKRFTGKRGWRSLLALKKRSRKASVTLYSISFYPWKMEPNAYYSHPDAAAEWVPDTASSRCQLCLVSFSITRRRHHCRICGGLVCNECSLQRTYFPLSTDRRNHHQLIKDGAPQRTCNSCAKTLKLMAEQSDHRVKKFTVDSASQDPCAADESDDALPPVGVQLGARSNCLVPLSVPARGRCRAEELDIILKARALSRKRDGNASIQYVINSQWLEQWLQYVHMGSDAPDELNASTERMRASATRSIKAHRPGPIANYCLLDFVNGKLYRKEDLERSYGNHIGGDYRIISEEVWTALRQLYGGGPSIRLKPNSYARPYGASSSRSSGHALIQSHNQHGEAADFAETAAWVITEYDDDMTDGKFVHSDSSIDLGVEYASSSQTRRSTTVSSMTRRRRDRVDQRSEPLTKGRATTSGHDTILHHDPARFHSDRQLQKARSSNDIALKRGCHSAMKASSRIEAVPDSGTILYDPSKHSRASSQLQQGQGGRPSVARDSISSSAASRDPRQTIAAVSAFAHAAAEARKKSAMSLSRHSSVSNLRSRTSLHSSVASA